MACSRVGLLRSGVAPAGVRLVGSLLRTTYGQPKATPRRYFTRCSLEPPDVPRLADTARISLTPKEIEEFGPKIRQVIDWFGQLQAVDLESIEPALRADTEVGDNLRLDSAVTFENKEALLKAVPSYDEPYIKVPRVLKQE